MKHINYFNYSYFRPKRLVWGLGKPITREQALARAKPLNAKAEYKEIEDLWHQLIDRKKKKVKKRQGLITKLADKLGVKGKYFSPELLRTIAESKELMKDESIRAYLVMNKNTPFDIVMQYAKDKSGWVRAEVAKNVAINPSTPPKTLIQFAKDEYWEIRQRVARNPSMPPKTLNELATDKEYHVRQSVARNPSTPPETLIQLAKSEDWGAIRTTVAGNPSTPPKTLIELAKDEYWGVKMMVAGNPSTPPKILKELATDKAKRVKRNALAALKKRGIEL